MDRETFAEMLGLDAKQIEDYENGEIPEKTYQQFDYADGEL